MGLLQCQLFQTPDAVRERLERCLLNDVDHITPGSRGEHVRKIQRALNRLSQGAGRENFNLPETGFYGPETARAVKKYKNAPQRRIWQPWQKTADDIVGKRTIKSLDDEMDILENESAATDRFVSTTLAGAPHNHATCPMQGSQRIEHFGTPVNPLGSGRKINLGGEGETRYLGFEDFLPNPFPVGPPRPLTSTLPDHCASDICMRDAPILKDGSREAGKQEILRIAMRGCRFTFCGDVAQFRAQLLSMGAIIEHLFISDARFPGSVAQALVIQLA